MRGGAARGGAYGSGALRVGGADAREREFELERALLLAKQAWDARAVDMAYHAGPERSAEMWAEAMAVWNDAPAKP